MINGKEKRKRRKEKKCKKDWGNGGKKEMRKRDK